MYIYGMWRQVVLLVVLGEEILYVVDAGYFQNVTSLKLIPKVPVAHRRHCFNSAMNSSLTAAVVGLLTCTQC
jgi:hypothetical protein